jgi:2-amino-4-hydroxy-6-hydroxymethyldihydropteridine diphosphokinase
VTRYAIGLGSNLGDRLQHLIEATGELTGRLGDLEVSPLYETAPVGGPAQDPFLNAVAVVDTDAEPLAVLDVCQAIELQHGRERQVRWGPRTLDLDIIASDGSRMSTDRLTIPHPRVTEREFVLRPLADLWPEAPVGDGLTAREALDTLAEQGVDRLEKDWIPPVSRWKSHAFLAAQFLLFLGVALALAYDGTLPQGGVSFIRMLGAAVAFVGLILAFIASRRLGPALAAPPLPRPGAELVTSGPYRLARHPIYGGIILFMLGTALIVDSVAGFFVAALLVPFFMVKARYEEKHLRMRYPGYLAYRQMVPRRLIPFVV